MSAYVYLNGKFLPEDQALVSVFDGGWLHGAGLFETMRAEHGRIFRLEAHLTRLQRSAERLLQPMDPADLPTASDFQELLDRNGRLNARVRLTVTSGLLRGDGGDDPPRFNVCATATELSPYPGVYYQEGIQAAISNYRQSPQDPTAGHKTTGYLPRLLALREARLAHCAEALWFTTGHRLAEGSISNVWLVRDGTMLTPTLDTPVLPGITREAAFSIACRERIEAREAELTVDDLLDADEVFLTNSIMQIVPVTCVEKRVIGAGCVGPMAKRLHEAYRELVRKECGG